MSIMDSHPHPSLARGNAAGSNLFDHEANTKPVIVNASAASSSVENASQSPSASHSHQHHHHHPNHPHHQFVDSSPVYHHPFRTITPNSAESNSKILDPQPQSKSSTPTNQQQTQSRPNSGSTSEWSVPGIALPPGSHQPPARRPFSTSANLEGSAPRDPPPTSSGAGTGYPSPTATSTSRRSSSNANPHPSPNQTELITSALTTTAPTAAPPYYQTHSAQDPASLAVIAAIDCSGLDVRPMYGSEDSRQTSGQNPNQPRNEGHTPSHTRVPSSEEMRGPYYTPAGGAHYSPTGSGMLPSHYPHLASPITPQSGPRRSASAATSNAQYTPYSNLSVQVPLGPNSYGHPQHGQHPDGPVLPGWTPSVDSVRDSVSPYSRPGRQPSGPLTGHHTPAATPFAHSIRNSQLMNSPHYPSSTNAAHHHQPGTMQYNAQGRPLAYMCNTCLRAFDRPSALQIHERSHTGERPFPCPWNGCVKRFTTHGNMVKHSRVCPFREPED
ncbi:hypothetical protein PGT21_020371 [Puccinia graminis f. sp. tritici]|uniref:C2H2-type domain-containing protein n=4 Tax=Puccinia graminis f. sp. tritici TaxID=56615 RepID=E3KBZ5_PUCGT|nr:uncharacterized protein PGTG_08233 [Puccinia graminis f. sp. tritici CRL 75-36-700-3]EFP81984.2 hypothetical protein PGTG_08233 [Puccinia graminis f. sp. tritici CRL 75-36-700-3]KAA1117704.1 hypothetical protein PGT21_020371 [Puccinia graminis f. sp. tritici]